MSIQVALRLPDDLVEYLDHRVSSGEDPSRASVVTRALERERRREIAAADAAILSAHGGYPDLDGLVSHTSQFPNQID